MRVIRTEIELVITKYGEAVEEDRLEELLSLISDFLELDGDGDGIVSSIDDEVVVRN